MDDRLQRVLTQPRGKQQSAIEISSKVVAFTEVRKTRQSQLVCIGNTELGRARISAGFSACLLRDEQSRASYLGCVCPGHMARFYLNVEKAAAPSRSFVSRADKSAWGNGAITDQAGRFLRELLVRSHLPAVKLKPRGTDKWNNQIHLPQWID